MIRDLMQQPSIDALAWTLIHFLWQGALLGVAAFIALRIARPERATTRYCIGVSTLGLMLVTSVITFATLVRAPRPFPAKGATFFASSPAPADAGQPVINQIDERVAPGTESIVSLSGISAWRPAPLGPAALTVVVTLWAIGVLALSLRLFGGWILTRQLAHRAVAAVSPSIDAAAKRIADRLQLRRAVSIVESGAVAVPTLVGWMKPVVLLPAAALSGLTPEQLQAILAHELAHVRRHDYLVNLLQSIVETLLFYHPAVWWASTQVRAEREHCCDDLAVDVCGDRLVYVSALAELTTMASHRQLALAATDGSLIGRVQRILGRPRSMHEPTPAWALLALLVLLAGSVGSFGAASADGVTPATDEAVTTIARVASPSVTALQTPAVQSRADRDAAMSEYLRQLETEETLRETARLKAESDAMRAEILKDRAENAAFFSSQWFRNWFDTPPAPPAPPASPAPPAPLAPLAPLAPEAPEAPEAPLAPAPPPAPEAPQAHGGSGNMSWHDGTEKITVKWNGAFRLSEDEKDIEWMEEGARVTISDGILFRSTIELRGVNGRIDRTFSKNGIRRDYEPEGRLFLVTAIDRMIKRSGLFAKERVAKYLKRGGPEAVLAEIDELGDSSYTHRIYYTELARQAELSESLLTRILQRVPAEMASDYDKATLFTQIAKLASVTEAHRVQVARAVRNISSDYDQRRTLTAIMEVQPLPAAVAAAVLDAAGSINSNYDRSLVLVEVAERGGLTPATTTAFMGLVRSMTSSYDQRRVLTAVSSQGSLPPDVASEAIKSAGAMSSSHDQSETLLKLIDRGGLTDASADSFFQSASRVSSSHDLSRVLRRVVDQPSMSDRLLEGVLRTAMRISSSHDRANLLEAMASRVRVQGPARQLYVDATQGMGSFDSNRALAALVRAEGQR